MPDQACQSTLLLSSGTQISLVHRPLHHQNYEKSRETLNQGFPDVLRNNVDKYELDSIPAGLIDYRIFTKARVQIPALVLMWNVTLDIYLTSPIGQLAITQSLLLLVNICVPSLNPVWLFENC